MKTLLNRGMALVLALLLALGSIGALAASKSVAINEKNFPDEAFSTFVQKKFDKNNDKKLSAGEIKRVKKINLNGREDITSLKGIEHFTNLTHLNCYRVSAKTLNLRKNTKLVSLDVGESSLTSLKLGKQKKLVNLDASFSELKSIDIGGCPKLLSAVKLPHFVEDDIITWCISKDNALWIDYEIKLMKGSKTLRQYVKPTSIKFTKKSIEIKNGKDYNLWKVIKLNPSTAVYEVDFESSKESVVYVGKDGGLEALKKGTAIITATVEGLTPVTIKVKVK